MRAWVSLSFLILICATSVYGDSHESSSDATQSQIDPEAAQAIAQAGIQAPEATVIAQIPGAVVVTGPRVLAGNTEVLGGTGILTNPQLGVITTIPRADSLMVPGLMVPHVTDMTLTGPMTGPSLTGQFAGTGSQVSGLLNVPTDRPSMFSGSVTLLTSIPSEPGSTGMVQFTGLNVRSEDNSFVITYSTSSTGEVRAQPAQYVRNADGSVILTTVGVSELRITSLINPQERTGVSISVASSSTGTSQILLNDQGTPVGSILRDVDFNIATIGSDGNTVQTRVTQGELCTGTGCTTGGFISETGEGVKIVVDGVMRDLASIGPEERAQLLARYGNELIIIRNAERIETIGINPDRGENPAGDGDGVGVEARASENSPSAQGSATTTPGAQHTGTLYNPTIPYTSEVFWYRSGLNSDAIFGAFRTNFLSAQDYFGIQNGGYFSATNSEFFSMNTLVRDKPVIVENAEHLQFSNGFIFLKKANLFIRDKTIVTNLNDLISGSTKFFIGRADSLYSECAKIYDIQNTTFKITEDTIEAVSNGKVKYNITDCIFNNVFFESNHGSLTMTKMVPPTYNVSNGTLIISQKDYTERVEVNNSALIEFDLQFGIACITMLPEVTYWYNDHINLKKDFAINVPPDAPNFKLCIRRSPDQNLSGYDGLVNLVQDYVYLNKEARYYRYPFKNNEVASLLMETLHHDVDNFTTTIQLDEKFIEIESVEIKAKDTKRKTKAITNPNNLFTIKESEINSQVHRLARIDVTRDAKHTSQPWVKSYRTDYFDPTVFRDGLGLVQRNERSDIRLLPADHEDIAQIVNPASN